MNRLIQALTEGRITRFTVEPYVHGTGPLAIHRLALVVTRTKNGQEQQVRVPFDAPQFGLCLLDRVTEEAFYALTQLPGVAVLRESVPVSKPDGCPNCSSTKLHRGQEPHTTQCMDCGWTWEGGG